MRPKRSGVGPRFLHVNSAATKLAIASIIGSVFFALAKDWVGALLPMQPFAVFHMWALWQPLTYAFVGRSPMEVIFGALIIWQIGSSLEATWGSRRLLLFSVVTSALAGLITLALALVSPALNAGLFFGLSVMATSIWVAYGLSFGRAQTNFWGMPVSGNTFALIGAGFVFLEGAYASWLAVVPEVFGLVLTVLYMKGASPHLVWLRFTSWRLQRQLRGRSKHLRVVSKDRNIGGGSDGYLH